MDLDTTLENEPVEKTLETETVQIYSPKLQTYVPIAPKGEMQHKNLGMGPGSWY